MGLVSGDVLGDLGFEYLRLLGEVGRLDGLLGDLREIKARPLGLGREVGVEG